VTDIPQVLVVGAAGMLGSKIVKNLLSLGNVRVRALLKSNDDDKAAALRRAGVEVVQGDLLKPETLDPACDGVRTIIAAVALGDQAVIVNGQTNLIRAAERAGVERMIPSDYSVDYFKLNKGDNYNLDMRREVSEVLASSQVKPTFVLNGGFTDVMLKWGPADYDAKTFSYWGEDDQKCDFRERRRSGLRHAGGAGPGDGGFDAPGRRRGSHYAGVQVGDRGGNRTCTSTSAQWF